jgi:FkbM family methyltransferase
MTDLVRHPFVRRLVKRLPPALVRPVRKRLIAKGPRSKVIDPLADSMRLIPSTMNHGPMRGLLFTGGDTVGYSLGASEPTVQRAVETHLQRGDVFYDVGANVGFLSLLAAKSVGPDGHVYCFEPQPSVLPLLTRNLEQNGYSNYDVIEAAVSDRPGHAKLELNARGRSGEARLASARAGHDVTSPRSGHAVDVRVVTLDELDLPAARLVKIDVEGAESQVLRGMARVMREHRPTLIIEIHDEQGSSVESILSEAGYRSEVLNDDGMRHLMAYPAAGPAA